MFNPKSTIHFPAGRRVRSIPFIHGFRTSAFVRPFGFAGRRSHSRAWSPETSKGPPFVSPNEGDAGVLRQTPHPVEVAAGAAAVRRQVRVDLGAWGAMEPKVR